MILMFARAYYSILSRVRRALGNIRVISLVLNHPDLPPFDTETLELIERLTSTPSPLEFGSLSHYVSDQSHRKVSLRNSVVINAGNALPPWNDLFDPPEEEGQPPIVKETLDLNQIVADQLGRRLLKYDIVIVYFNGTHPWNATTYTASIHISERPFLSRFYSLTHNIPLIKIGLPVLDAGYTSTVCHELFHAFQIYYSYEPDHAPYIEGQESSSSTYPQRNCWHNLASGRRWGVMDTYYQSLAVGVSACNCSKFGWYNDYEKIVIDAPVTNRTVVLHTTSAANQISPKSTAYICEINTSSLASHPEGYMIEARARRGYDANLIESGVLIHKLDNLTSFPHLGPFPFILGPLPPGIPTTNQEWRRFVFGEGDVFERPGIRIEVTNATLGPDGVPELFELDITVQ